jgi:hypothetical protein
VERSLLQASLYPCFAYPIRPRAGDVNRITVVVLRFVSIVNDQQISQE